MAAAAACVVVLQAGEEKAKNSKTIADVVAAAGDAVGGQCKQEEEARADEGTLRE